MVKRRDGKYLLSVSELQFWSVMIFSAGIFIGVCIPYLVSVMESETSQVSKDKAITLEQVYHVGVDCSKSMREAVVEGVYMDVDDRIYDGTLTTTYCYNGKHRGSLSLVKFDEGKKIDEALAFFKEKGWRPANIRELLAFGRDYPDVQREVEVLSLGSMGLDHVGYLLVPYLTEDAVGNRKLKLERAYQIASPNNHFLVAKPAVEVAGDDTDVSEQEDVVTTAPD